MLTVRFDTLGCKLNQIETESLAHAFREAGFQVEDRAVYLPVGIESEETQSGNDPKTIDHDEASRSNDAQTPVYRTVGPDPELCVVNTCTVTGKAEQKARRLIRMLLRAYPSATVLVTGCYAEVEEPAIRSIDPRVAVFPGSRKGSLADLPRFLMESTTNATKAPDSQDSAVAAQVRAFCLTHAAAQKTEPAAARAAPAAPSTPPNAPEIPETFKLSTDDFLFHSRASIKIQDGCDNRCAYCRIRLARGKAVSLDRDEVIARVKKIEEAGWGEVVLSGVNLSQYRSSGGDFADLLERLIAATERIAIRIGSLYPERVDEAILPALASARILPHFHLSVQSGSDRILKAMRRPYAADAVYRAAERLRSIKENPFLACDIITGFPGETDEDFAQTLKLCSEVGFAAIHAFPFSPRPGTEAWGMRPRVPERVAGERVAALTALAELNHRAYAEYWVGRTVSAVAEECAPGEPVTAVTENYLSVALDADMADIPRGKRIAVRITGVGKAELAR
ncbi:MAG TPA: tRNA (N(6)-L-threonylcarbamoyladenosine(37)-C(2))-methylthiotransferase MtaB [Treponemataceae bacterium]|nr:tRNA (N(6)-L-threonylcarbamoyladenosine(37)-C(2))-methylthiotransferase MtaB [Treponemataceae bacterium]